MYPSGAPGDRLPNQGHPNQGQQPNQNADFDINALLDQHLDPREIRRPAQGAYGGNPPVSYNVGPGPALAPGPNVSHHAQQGAPGVRAYTPNAQVGNRNMPPQAPSQAPSQGPSQGMKQGMKQGGGVGGVTSSAQRPQQQQPPQQQQQSIPAPENMNPVQKPGFYQPVSQQTRANSSFEHDSQTASRNYNIPQAPAGGNGNTDRYPGGGLRSVRSHSRNDENIPPEEEDDTNELGYQERDVLDYDDAEDLQDTPNDALAHAQEFSQGADPKSRFPMRWLRSKRAALTQAPGVSSFSYRRVPLPVILAVFYVVFLFMFSSENQTTKDIDIVVAKGANEQGASKADPTQRDHASAADTDAAAVTANQISIDTLKSANDVFKLTYEQVKQYAERQTFGGKPTEATLFQLSTASNAKRIIYGKRKNALYCPLSRTGSLAWKYLIRKWDEVPKYEDLATIWDPEKNGMHYIFQYPFMEAEKLYNKPGIVKFLFVRNPYSRLLSLYIDKVENADIESSEFKMYMEYFHSKKYAETVKVKPTFEEFVRGIFDRKNRLNNIHEAWLPQTTLCYVSVIDYEFIGRYENLEVDSAIVFRLLNTTDVFPSRDMVFQSDSNASHPEVLSKYYNKSLRDLVYLMFRKDFDILGYEKDSVKAV